MNQADAGSGGHFVIRLYGLDDHRSELREAMAVARRNSYSPTVFDTASQWASAIAEADDDSVLISDNRIEGLDDLGVLGHSDIDTGRGNSAGIRLLTDYCERANVSSRLRILLTNFPLDKRMREGLDRKSRKGHNIVAIHKYDPNHLTLIDEILNKHYIDRLGLYIKEKFEFVSEVLRDWGLSNREWATFMGVSHRGDALMTAAMQGTTSRDLESRCDLIYRLKVNLDYLLGAEDEALQAKWLRSALAPLSNQTPIDFLEDGRQPRLAELLFRIEEPGL